MLSGRRVDEIDPATFQTVTFSVLVTTVFAGSCARAAQCLETLLMPRIRLFSPLLLAALFAVGGVACQQKSGGVHEMTSRTATKAHAPADPNMSSAQRFGFGTAPQTASVAQTAPQFQWETPAGWQMLAPKPMRDINLAVGDQTECFVSALSASAGGLAANVNRWRQQMGLAPESEETIAALPSIEVMGYSGTLVEIEGTYSGMRGDQNAEGYKMLAAFVPAGDRTVTIKMIGPADEVGAERDNFGLFAQSLSVSEPAETAQDHTHDHDHAEHASDVVHDSAGDLAFEVPAYWKRVGERPMRLVTYVLGTVGETECYISPLSGTGGGVEANLNRWLGQMGQPPLDAAAIDALPKLSVLDQEVSLLETSGTFTSMRGETKSGYAMVGVFLPMSDTSYSLKIIGPEEDVTANKAAFVAFCESLHTH